MVLFFFIVFTNYPKTTAPVPSMFLMFTLLLPAKLKPTCRYKLLRSFLQFYTISFAALQNISPISSWVDKQLRMFTNKKPTTILYHQSINTRKRLKQKSLNSNSTNKSLHRDYTVVETIIGVKIANSTMLNVSSGS